MTMSARDRILLGVIAAVLAVGGVWWFGIKPASADLAAERDTLAQVQEETGALRDTLARLSRAEVSPGRIAAQRLRLAKAVPAVADAPGVIVQLQRLADRSNVDLTSIKTNSFSDYGAIRATEFEVRVSGRFFDADDFLYRLHRQVAVDEGDRPIIGGRLFATTSVDLTLDTTAGTGGAPDDDDRVIATLKILAFSSVPGGAAADPTAAAAVAAAGTPVASTATPAAGTGGVQ